MDTDPKLPPTVKPLVFVSYASPDLALGERVRDDLEADGLPCWMAPRDVPAGADYARSISDAIEACEIFLLVLSAASNVSPHIEREVHLAAARKMPILPLRSEPVVPDGALQYLLANAQWFDAFPRLEPRLHDLRNRVRAMLEARGAAVPASSSQPRYRRVLAAVAAWAVVLGLMALATAWLQAVSFNLVPLSRVPLVIAQQAPLLLLLILGFPALALALQYTAHRNLAHVLWLDALFAVKAGRPARMRTAGAAIVGVVLAFLTVQAPAAVTVELREGAIDPAAEALTRALTCSPRNYIVQPNSHFVVRTHVGSRNPPGNYRLRVELGPYATRDGIEFCEVRLDQDFGMSELVPGSDDRRRSGFVELAGPLDALSGDRTLMFNVTHYRDSSPSDQCWVLATLSLSEGLIHDVEQKIPTSIWPAE